MLPRVDGDLIAAMGLEVLTVIPEARGELSVTAVADLGCAVQSVSGLHNGRHVTPPLVPIRRPSASRRQFVSLQRRGSPRCSNKGLNLVQPF